MIAIIDYGLGNIQAFLNIYSRLQIPAVAVKHSNQLVDVSHIILPGVGAFDWAMQKFTMSGLMPIVQDFVLTKKVPVLGICVGMQMMAQESEEGSLPGLGWFSGKVKKFSFEDLQSQSPLPHMGWNLARKEKESALFKDFDNSPYFYFLHSFYYLSIDKSDVASTSSYGIRFASAIQRENIFGVQFHPEKSHNWGVKLLKNFSEI